MIHCHQKTKNLDQFTQQADILIVATGQAKLINVKSIKKGCVVIDVGIHRLPDGKLIGDVDTKDMETIAAAISPVPGGVGPMTIAQLMQNTIEAAENSSL